MDKSIMLRDGTTLVRTETGVYFLQGEGIPFPLQMGPTQLTATLFDELREREIAKQERVMDVFFKLIDYRTQVEEVLENPEKAEEMAAKLKADMQSIIEGVSELRAA